MTGKSIFLSAGQEGADRMDIWKWNGNGMEMEVEMEMYVGTDLLVICQSANLPICCPPGRLAACQPASQPAM